jgi:Na+/H+-dicarboxylate symporter
MIIAPLVFSTLVVGIAHMGDTAALGRVGAKAVAGSWRQRHLAQPRPAAGHVLPAGSALGLPLPPADATAGVDRSAFDFAKFIAHIFPESMIEAMADNEILQIVVFSIFVGVAITAVGEPARPLVRATEALVKVMLQITDYVMRFAPIAVFAAVAATIAQRGLGILATFGYFMGTFYIGLAILWALLIGAASSSSAAARGCWCDTSRSARAGLSRPPRPKPPIRARWRRWTGSACRRGSPASCCRWATRSISTAR